MVQQGIRTGRFGKWVSEYVAQLSDSAAHQVYYDHGDITVEANVVATKGIFGEKATNLSRLTDVDVMIVGPPDTVHLLFEIEERAVSPKKLLGNVLACLLCNRFAVKIGDELGGKKSQKYFRVTTDTVLCVAGYVPNSGVRLKKIYDTIQPRLHSLTGLADGMRPSNVRLFFTEHLDATMEKLKEFVKERFPAPHD